MLRCLRNRKTTHIHRETGIQLPDELLLDIFQLSVLRPDYDDLLWLGPAPEPVLVGHAPPWSLTLVCRRWNALVMSCAALWTAIILPRNPSPAQIRMVHVQLSRSGQLPLTIALPYILSNDVLELVDSCFRQSHRWKAVALPNSLPPIQQIPSLPLLETLFLANTMMPPFLPPLSSWHFPRLRTLHLTGHYVGDVDDPQSILQPHVSFPRLTHLTLTWTNSPHLLHLLRKSAPSLTFLHLTDIRAKNQEPIVFEHLARLRLTDVSSSFSNALICPRLDEFCARFIILERHPWTYLPYPTITSADLTWSPHTEYAPLLEYLQASSQLTRLRLRTSGRSAAYSHRMEHFLNLLTNPSICPLLTRISMTGLRTHPRVQNQIIAFLQLVRSRALVLRYASLQAEDLSGASFIQTHWQNADSVCSDDCVYCQIENMIENIRIGHPHLELYVIYMFTGEFVKKSWFKSRANELCQVEL